MVDEKRFTIAILQARISSSRLPGKVMLKINGEPMIYRQIERIQKASTIDEIIVATSTDSSDDPLSEFLVERGLRVFRGELDDVLSRFLMIQNELKPTAVIRLTGDCPLVMPKLIDRMVLKFYDDNLDYLSNTLKPTYPDGLDIEVISPSALRKLETFDLSIAEKEHVTLGIYSRPSKFSFENFCGDGDFSNERWTVDYIEDLEFVRNVFREFQGREPDFTFEDVMLFLSKSPNLRSTITADRRNEKLSGVEIVE